MSLSCLLYFEEDEIFAQDLSNQAKLTLKKVGVHRFPDGEFKLTLPDELSSHVFVLRSLNHPNENLIELLLTCKTARRLGAGKITLIAPYLAYMRQDIAFQPGEAISQQIILSFLENLVDQLITVDPHLHRIKQIEDVAPLLKTKVLSGAPTLGAWIANFFSDNDTEMAPILLGPDEESMQWLSQAASPYQFTYAACQKERHGDYSVSVKLPELDLSQRSVVILDDVASSGRTLAQTIELVREAGAKSVDVAITHALFNGDARETILKAGVRHIWSTNTVRDTSNVVSIVPEIAKTLSAML